MALYGAETWTLGTADHKYLEIFEMKCWDNVRNYSRPWRSYCFLFSPCIRAARLIHRQRYVIESAGRANRVCWLCTSECRLKCAKYQIVFLWTKIVMVCYLKD